MPEPLSPRIVWRALYARSEVGWIRDLLDCPMESFIFSDDPHAIESGDLVVDDLKRSDAALRKHLGKLDGLCLLHISDERYGADLSLYRFFAQVVRNYWRGDLTHPAIAVLPLGYTLAPPMQPPPPLAARPLCWVFAGHLCATRFAMVKALKDIGPHEAVVSDERGGPRLEPEDYRTLLLRSRFLPCPQGNVNLESFRLYEALEHGAIPLVEKRGRLDYYRALLGDHPLPTVTSWAQGRAVMAMLEADPARRDALALDIAAWWKIKKLELGEGLRACLATSRLGDTALASFTPPGILATWRTLLAHQNAESLRQRVLLSYRRLRKSSTMRTAPKS